MLHLLKKPIAHISALLALSSTGYGSQVLLTQPADGWHYSFAPYLWTSSINGELQVGGRTARVNLPFKDILKHLDFAFQGHFEAGSGAWTLMFDPTYLKVTDEGQLHSIGLKVTSKSLLADLGAFYRLFYKPIADDRYMSVELLGGVRHFGIRNTLDISVLTLSNFTSMNAPIIGARLKADVANKSYFWLRGDYGGFHVDHFQQTWSTTAGFTYAVKPHIELGIAYRVLNINFAKGNHSMNTLLHGPAVGVSFHS